MRVATVLTACGIETLIQLISSLDKSINELQQCLPLAVLKQASITTLKNGFNGCNSAYRLRY